MPTGARAVAVISARPMGIRAEVSALASALIARDLGARTVYQVVAGDSPECGRILAGASRQKRDPAKPAR